MATEYQDLTTFLYSYSKVLVHRTELNDRDFSDSTIDYAVQQSILYPVGESDWFLVLPEKLTTVSTDANGTLTRTPTEAASLLVQTANDPASLANDITLLQQQMQDLTLYLAGMGFKNIPESLLVLLEEL